MNTSMNRNSIAGGRELCVFYDPDHHIIEVAEDLVMVMKCFADSGMSVEEVAVRMDVPVSYIKEHIGL